MLSGLVKYMCPEYWTKRHFEWDVLEYPVKAKPPQFPEGVLRLELELLVDLGNGTGTYGAATLTDRETLSLFKRNRLN